jgi:L-ascorbate metabolism protein UlaG (beta-lactamase superfamily)
MPSGTELEYYGFSSFSIDHEETRMLVDPWLTEPEWIVADPADFADVEYIFVTHGAYDHLGDTFAIAESSGAQVFTEPAVADHLIDEGLPSDQVERVIWGNAFEVDGIGVRVLETRHLSYFDSTSQRLSGMPVGFHFEFLDSSLYYVGDTSLFSDLKLFTKQNDPDVVLLPVGGAPGDLAPLPPRDAATAASWFDVDHIIPVHYVPGSDEVAEFKTELASFADDERHTVTELSVNERFEL